VKLFRGVEMKVVLFILLLSHFAAAQMTGAALLQLDRDFALAASEKRLDRWMNFMMDSTVIFGSTGSTGHFVGKEEIRNYYGSLFAMPDFSISLKSQSAEILPSGRTGYTKGTFQWRLPDHKCRCVNEERGTYLAVWERDPSCPPPNGPWKLKALFPAPEDGSNCACQP
jgi:ketosteroid isomerase-like protein